MAKAKYTDEQLAHWKRIRGRGMKTGDPRRGDAMLFSGSDNAWIRLEEWMSDDTYAGSIMAEEQREQALIDDLWDDSDPESNPRATKRTKYRFKSTSGSDKGKTYDWSYGQLADTLFESNGWDSAIVARNVKNMRPGQTIKGPGGTLTRLKESNPAMTTKTTKTTRKSNPVEPTVRGFITILNANLTQYDMAQSAREAKGRGSVNVYRLGHLLGASQKLEDRLKSILDSSSTEDLRTLRSALVGKAFLADFPPSKKTVKAIDKYLADGKPPAYPTSGKRKNPTTHKTKGRKSNPAIKRGTKAWHRRNLILPSEIDHPQAGRDETLVGTLYAWHGGQDSAVYSLASTGDHDYVSASMIESAMDELERSLNRAPTHRPVDVSDLVRALGEMNIILGHPEDFTTKNVLGEDVDSGYDDYGLGRDQIDNPPKIPKRGKHKVKRRPKPKKKNPEATTSQTTARILAIADRLVNGE